MRIVNKFCHLSKTIKDKWLCRKEIGVDRIGISYYQYYSSVGLQTKRECFLKNRKSKCDNLYFNWLNGYQLRKPNSKESIL